MYTRTGALAAALTLTLLACDSSSRAPAAARPEPTDSAVIADGGAAAARLAAGLLVPLTRSVEEHGPAGAIDFCSREALRLTAAIQDSIGSGLSLRRTTLQYRNPGNAPDSLDRVVLEDLAARLQRGDSLPPHVVQRTADGARFYRPLRIQPLCLQCHGGESEIPADVRALLRERYPDDRATGYRVGDLRGVIRVDLPRPGVS